MFSLVPISLRGKPVEMRDPFYFRELISKWIPQKQVYPFVYGDDALGAFVCGTAAYATYFFRHTYRMGGHARLSIYAPTLVFSAMTSTFYHQIVITGQIINPKACPVCIQVQSAIGQVLISTLFPLITSGIACTYFADKLLTYPVPSLIQAPKEVFQLWWKLIKGNRTVFLLHGTFQMILAMAVTYEKQICFAELQEKCLS